MKRNLRKFVLFVLLGLMLFTACQKTPEQEIVVAKDGKLEQIVMSTPATAIEYTFPQAYKAYHEITDKLSIDIDANVIRPDGSMYPVYTVEYSPFTAEQVNSLIDAIYGDVLVYKQSALRNKEDIEAEIINLKKIAAEVAAGNQQGDLGALEEMIHTLESEWSAAPDLASDTLYDGTMNDDAEGSYLKVYGKLGKEQDATLEIRNYDDSKSAILLFTNGKEYWADGKVNGQAEGLFCTATDAIEQTSQWLKRLGMDDFAPVFCRVGSAYQSGDMKGSEGYVVVCERYIERMPVTYNLNSGTGSSINNTPDFSQRFNKEKLTFTVDDTGITTIKWENPIRYTVKNQNVPLASFEDMLDHLLQDIKYKFAWVENSNGAEGTTDSVAIHISQIKLGLAVVPEKDSMGKYLLVPAWDFFGTESMYQGDDADISAYDDRSFLTINAIDGSIID